MALTGYHAANRQTFWQLLAEIPDSLPIVELSFRNAPERKVCAMGLDSLFRVRPGGTIIPPPRKCCAKCGNALSRIWNQSTCAASDAFCRPCRWLLRFWDSSRPSDEILLSLGLPTSCLDENMQRLKDFDVRQHAEPEPFVPLVVEDWPEIDGVSVAPAFDPFALMFGASNS